MDNTKLATLNRLVIKPKTILDNLAKNYLAELTRQSYATLLTTCCATGLNENVKGVASLAEIADLLSTMLKLFDDVIDDDVVVDEWQTREPLIESMILARGTVVNLGTAVFALAAKRLADLNQKAHLPQEAFYHLQSTIFENLAPIINGQQASILIQTPSLEQAVQIAKLKSGHFYGLVCWNAAYLATLDTAVADTFKKFGQIFGMMVQIANDMSDIWSHDDASSDLKKGLWSLPVAYTMSVLPESEKPLFINNLALAQQNDKYETKARETIVKSGAFVYWQIENTMRFNQAKKLLTQHMAPSASHKKLIELMNHLITVKKNE